MSAGVVLPSRTGTLAAGGALFAGEFSSGCVVVVKGIVVPALSKIGGSLAVVEFVLPVLATLIG
jgi:hypothetical protein